MKGRRNNITNKPLSEAFLNILEILFGLSAFVFERQAQEKQYVSAELASSSLQIENCELLARIKVIRSRTKSLNEENLRLKPIHKQLKLELKALAGFWVYNTTVDGIVQVQSKKETMYAGSGGDQSDSALDVLSLTLTMHMNEKLVNVNIQRNVIFNGMHRVTVSVDVIQVCE